MTRLEFVRALELFIREEFIALVKVQDNCICVKLIDGRIFNVVVSQM